MAQGHHGRGAPGPESRHDRVEAVVRHEAQIVGLKHIDVPTLEDVEHRRLHLWIVMVVIVLATTAGMVGVSLWGDSEHNESLLTFGVLGLVAGFCAYSIEKELHLRRLTKVLVDERVLVTALASRLEELSVLLDAGQAMNAVLELEEVLRRILDNALDLLGASDGSVLLADDETKLLRAVCVRGNEAARDAVVPFGTGIAGRVAETLESLLIQGDLDSGRAHHPHSAMSVPLVHRGELLGVLNVNAAHDRTFDEYDLRALSLFGEHAASAIANARLYEQERANAIALAHRAFHDPLTDLANRTLLIERLGEALSMPIPGRTVAVLWLDLDDFKRVNDSLGHAAGDELLREVSARLRSVLRPADLAARLGGDEFAVVLDDVRSEEDAVHAGERVLLALSSPITIGDRTVSVRASIGVAVANAHEWTTDELLRNADVAMYIAKSQGKACVRAFEESMHDALVARLELETELERAVEEAQLLLHYQPIVELRTGQIVGMEALVRWQHPQRGLLLPGEFIPLAEETGQVLPIDRWVLLQACCQARQWQLEVMNGAPLEVSVNLSTRQLEDDQVIDMVKLALEVSGLAPESLVLEVTESFVLRDEVAGARRLRSLRELGVRLAIDDFGTGYSSLSYLRQLPVDVLKIDRSFTAGIGENQEDVALVQAIMRLADSLGLDAVAEGVEDANQRDVLVSLGCAQGQGWHFSKAVEPTEMEALLRLSATLPQHV
jgi:diguanylate cyclase (GGDEF)-like protein